MKQRERYKQLTDQMRDLMDAKDKDWQQISELQAQIKQLHDQLYNYK